MKSILTSLVHFYSDNFYSSACLEVNLILFFREYCNQLDYKPISITDPIQSLQICVAVRKRPMNKKGIF